MILKEKDIKKRNNGQGTETFETTVRLDLATAETMKLMKLNHSNIIGMTKHMTAITFQCERIHL